MTITLYNSKTRRKEAFEPLERSNVRMYVCGPTVYDRAHLGNARPAIVFDVLYRLLRHTYGAGHVTYVRNFTDVDDKINAKAAATGRSITDICDETIGWYLADMDAVGVLKPSHMPRATEFIPQMIAMIEKLIASGHAYAAHNHVMFRVRSYKNYGALSGRSVDDMIAGARVEISPFKEDPMDFVLWKPSSADEPGWDSPWGFGRPGWHIECSAMAQELLGDTFDIHGGGLDLQFPHHENELAQSCCAHPEGGFAKVWMHNEMLQVEGKKMSKSLGNFFTVRDLLDGSETASLDDTNRFGRKATGPEIRMVFLMSHYGKPMDWNNRRHYEATTILREFTSILAMGGYEELQSLKAGTPIAAVVEALSENLDTNRALQFLRKKSLLSFYGKNRLTPFLADIYASQLLLGFDLKKDAIPIAIAKSESVDENRKIIAGVRSLHDYQIQLTLLRNAALSTKDFSAVDAFKAALTASGIEVRMSKTGVDLKPTPTFDSTKLEGLL